MHASFRRTHLVPAHGLSTRSNSTTRFSAFVNITEPTIPARYRLSQLQYATPHPPSPQVSYSLGVNKFTDLDSHEMQSFMGFSGVQSSLYDGKHASGVHTPGMTFSRQFLLDIPPETHNKTSKGTVKDVAESLNWVERGAVTPVRDQGSCGSCWAQATTAEMESFLAINTGFLTDCTLHPMYIYPPFTPHVTLIHSFIHFDVC